MFIKFFPNSIVTFDFQGVSGNSFGILNIFLDTGHNINLKPYIMCGG